MQWFEDWRMPRCFRTVEAGLGRAGLKGPANERYSVCVAILFSWFQGFVRWDAADAINFFCEEGLIVAAFNEISNEFFTALIKEGVCGAYAT